MTRYFAIIPAAGIGTRFKLNCPKQYLKIRDETILERVVNLFSTCHAIEKVVVVLHAKDHWWQTISFKNPHKILTTLGGDERVRSVLLGLDFLKDIASEEDFVVVHDAARPCLKLDDVTRLMDAVKNHPVGGLLGLPVVDTLKKVNKQGDVESTVSRDELWYAQTPQCFRYALLKNAIEFALSKNKIVTDESSAIEYAGYYPKMVPGNPNNIKITFSEDWDLVSAIWDL